MERENQKVEEPEQIGSWLKIWNPVRTAAEMKSAIPPEGERTRRRRRRKFPNFTIHSWDLTAPLTKLAALRSWSKIHLKAL